MKTALTILALALLSGPALAGRPRAQRPPRTCRLRQGSVLHFRPVLQHGLGGRSAANTLLGVIRLGDPTPMNLSPLYRGQLLVHGMGFSPDHRTLLAVSIVRTRELHRHGDQRGPPHRLCRPLAARSLLHAGRPRGLGERARRGPYRGARCRHRQGDPPITVPNGPGMTIFSPDGTYGYVCSSFSPETVVIDTKTHTIVGRVKQESPFCPDIAATPDGKQVWVHPQGCRPHPGVFGASALRAAEDDRDRADHQPRQHRSRPRPPVRLRDDRRPEPGQGFRTDDFLSVATIATGALPHGLWPSGDGSRVYVSAWRTPTRRR